MLRQDILVRRLDKPTEAEFEKVISALVTAFHDEPVTRIIVGGDISLLPQKIGANVRAAAVGGEIHVASPKDRPDDIAGAAIWFGPGQTSLSTKEQIDAGWNKFMEVIPEDLRTWWNTYLVPNMKRFSDEVLGPGFKGNNWHLLLLGVTPGRQNQGYASAMMSFGKQLAGADKKAIVLETATDLDVQIYQHLSFRIVGQTTIESPWGETTLFQMVFHEDD